jgi:hypothetical protein
MGQRNPAAVENGCYRRSTIPGGAGFLPSTVCFKDTHLYLALDFAELFEKAMERKFFVSYIYILHIQVSP